MKRFFCLILTLICLFSAVSCTGTAPVLTGDKPLIVTSVFPIYDFCRVLLGENATLQMLIPPGVDSHSYDPTPQDMVTLEGADLFLFIGGESDAHIRTLLAACPDVETADFSALLTCTPDHDHTHDHEHPADEHLWTSPKKAMEMVRLLEKTLSDRYPEFSEQIALNAAAYQEELRLLDGLFEAEAHKNKLLVFGDQFPFTHLAADYGFSYLAALDSCGEKAEPSAARLAELTEKAREQNVTTVFYTEVSNGKIAANLASELSAETARLHSCHNLSAEEWEAEETYLTLMRQNLKLLQDA